MKRKKFKLIFNIFFFSIVILIIIFNKEITTYIVSNYIYNKNATTELKRNEYALNKDYHFVQITDDFIAQDYQHLLNIFYTILDSGEKEFYFYCSEDYKNCTKDIDKLIPDSLDNQKETDVLADINNLVHPYNSYESLTVVMNNYGKITIKVNKQYSNSDINYINNSIQEIEKNIIKDNMTLEDKIKSFHDYIINNTKYDTDRSDKKVTKYESDNAYGTLIENYAICGGCNISNLNYNKHDIECLVSEIYKDGKVYLDECRVDHKKVEYKYTIKCKICGKQFHRNRLRRNFFSDFRCVCGGKLVLID